MNDSERLKREKLKEALWRAENMEEDIDYSNLPEPILSKKFRKEIKRLDEMAVVIEKNNRRRMKNWEKWIVAAAVLMFVIILSAKPVNAIVKGIIEIRYINHGGYTTYEYDIKEDNKKLECLEEKYIPGWVPEGYELEKMTWYDREDTGMCAAEYINEDGKCIGFIQSIPEVGGRKDSEDAIVTIVNINGNEGRLYTNLMLNGLKWDDEKYIYSINFDDLTEEEVVKIAESLIEYKQYKKR